MTTLNLTVIAAIGIIVHQAMWVNKELPKPQKFMWVAVVWGVLALLAETGAGSIAAAFAVGLVLAMAYSFYTPYTKKLGKADKPAAA